MKYLETPAPPPSRRHRTSKLEPFKPAIAELLEQDPSVPVPVLTQRLRTLGYEGGETIVKDYLRALRAEAAARRAYVRVEPGPGERFEVDWGPLRSAPVERRAPQALRLLPGGGPQSQDVSGIHAQPVL